MVDYLQSPQDNKEKSKVCFDISDETILFVGTQGESDDHMICPVLMHFVSREFENVVSIMKYLREVREERNLNQKNKKDDT